MQRLSWTHWIKSSVNMLKRNRRQGTGVVMGRKSAVFKFVLVGHQSMPFTMIVSSILGIFVHLAPAQKVQILCQLCMIPA